MRQAIEVEVSRGRTVEGIGACSEATVYILVRLITNCSSTPMTGVLPGVL